METTLVSMVCLALVIISSVSMMISSFGSINTILDSWRSMEDRADEKRRTMIYTDSTDNYTGGPVEILVANQGSANIGAFDEWDLIAKYEDGTVTYINYTEDADPDINEWTVEDIVLSDNTSVSEIFDPSILNPGESAILKLNLDPEISIGEYGLITTSTNVGVTAQCHVFRQ